MRIFIAASLIVVLLGFQNCGEPFSPATVDALQLQPTQVPLPTVKKSYVYLGRSTENKEIARVMIDHTSDDVIILPTVSTPHFRDNVLWITFSSTLNKLLVLSDAFGANSNFSLISFYDIKPDGDMDLVESESGNEFSPRSVKSYFAVDGGVHLSVLPTSDPQIMFAGVSGYNSNSFGIYQLDLNASVTPAMPSITPQGIAQSFGTDARTHSSAFDTKRELIYVANSGANKVEVLKMNGVSAPVPKATITAAINPRIVLYNEKYDLAYIVTEDQAANSKVLIVRTEVDEAGEVLSSVIGQHELSRKYGGDIKIDEVNGYVVATLRELGRSGVEFIPINADGTFDIETTSRSTEFVSTLNHPRSVNITSNGKYVFIAYNVTNNLDLTIYKMTYGPNKQIADMEWLGDFELGPPNSNGSYGQGFNCQAIIDVMADGTLR